MQSGHMAPMRLLSSPTDETFEEAAYLSSNPDVAAAVAAGKFPSGRAHFEAFGHAEGRLQRRAVLAETRRAKLARVEPLLRTDMERRDRDGKPDFLSDQLRAESRIVDTENVSGHGYDGAVIQMIEDVGPGGLVLDAGAGRRDVYYPNVVNYEIVDYDTTDVIGVGEALPFVDHAFDGVVSIAVLEHVRDPFRCAQEIVRVLKPGGRLVCTMPFLQPLHGYPHHYFNATEQGLRRLFEGLLQIDDVSVPPSLHPAWALQWIVQSWSHALPPAERAAFLDQPVRDLLRPGHEILASAFSRALPAHAVAELACGFLLLARKAGSDHHPA